MMRTSVFGVRLQWSWAGALIHGIGIVQALLQAALMVVAALFMCAALSGGDCPCGGADGAEQERGVNRTATVADGESGGGLTQTSATPRGPLTEPEGESPSSTASAAAALVADPAEEARGESPPVSPEFGRSRDRPE